MKDLTVKQLISYVPANTNIKVLDTGNRELYDGGARFAPANVDALNVVNIWADGDYFSAVLIIVVQKED